MNQDPDQLTPAVYAAPETERRAPAADEPLELWPRRTMFLFTLLALPLTILAVIGLAGAVALALAQQVIWIAALLLGLALLAGFSWWTAEVAWTKERYQFFPSRISATRGTILSDQETELNVRNITHVKVRLPWLRWRLFGVGDVMIESAGSEASEITLRAIDEPLAVYEDVQRRMRGVGFRLAKRGLFHEEHPDMLGVAVETSRYLISALIAIGVAVGEVMGSGFVTDSGLPPALAYFLLLTGPLVALGGLTGVVLHFFDLSRRTYSVFQDAIVYEEGFLTRDNAVIPAENLADSATQRTFLDQILGLYDVEISCQGSASSIKFRRLRHGPQLSGAVDQLISELGGGLQAPERTSVPAAASGSDGQPPAEHPAQPASLLPERVLLPPEETWGAQLTIDVQRELLGYAALGLAVFPAFPFVAFAAVSGLIRALCTRYEVRPGSVKSVYRFLSTREREFTYDKITGAVYRESPLDRLLGTCTLELWSIGAKEPLELRHVRRHLIDLDRFLFQLGIQFREPRYDMPSRFDLGRFARANLIGLAVLPVLLLAGGVAAVLVSPWIGLAPLGLLLLVLLSLVYLSAYYPRCGGTFFDDHVQVRQGLFWRSVTFARYDTIKRITVTRFPWGREGGVHFAVAGEQLVGGGNSSSGPGKGDQGKQGVPRPYGMEVGYVEGLPVKGLYLDQVLAGELHPEALAELDALGEPALPEPLLECRPDLGNTLVALVISSVVVPFLLPLLPVTIPITIARLRKRRYRLEAERAVRAWGLIYRSQSSVLYSRIDSIRKERGALNKLFGNGTVTILTAGSSAPDLVLDDVQDWEGLYEELRRHYRAHS